MNHQTPRLPDEIRSHRVVGYVNALTALPEETRLFGTESLYGDWRARLFVVAQDFGCWKLVQDRIDRKSKEPEQFLSRPYSHKDIETNRRLSKRCAPFMTSWDASPDQCGILYGSALASLCRDDGRMRGSLPNLSEARLFGEQAIGWTLQELPELQCAVCLGRLAWDCVTAAVGMDAPHELRSGLSVAVPGRSWRLVAAYHPMASVESSVQDLAWRAVGECLGAGSLRAAA